MPASTPVDRLARAAQDCRTTFGETTDSTMTINGREVACTVTPTLHSPGPKAQLEQRAAREAVQSIANALLADGQHDEARDLLADAAAAEHAEYPQYDGFWDQHTLGVATRRTAFKGGRYVQKGDAMLLGELSEREWDDSGKRDWSAYSASMGGDICLPERNAMQAPAVQR